MRAFPYQPVPILRADNGPVAIHPDDRRYGTLVVGGQGSGKTSLLHRLYQNDIRDPNAAVIVLDPKSELARLCLETTPPYISKRVWYLDLGRPMFGMSPLRLVGEGPVPVQASAVADNIASAFGDLFEGQVYQSSRRYLFHAIVAAIAMAERAGQIARFEQVYGLLRPKQERLHQAAWQATQHFSDLGHTTEFFKESLPDELRQATAATYQRLDPPTNKLSALLAPPSLRRFFNHPTDISLKEIVEARDILLIDANMATVGGQNAQAILHFVMWMLHAQLQRQVQQPEDERPRVALLADEAHYIASSENIVDQIATHRAAGLDVTFGLQYFAQLGAGSELYGEKILKGVLNLLQSKFLFRLGDPEDAERATRIAMSVYQSMIRSDPDSRALQRVSVESALNIRNHHCIASPICDQSRAGSFAAQTYAFMKRRPEWATENLERQAERVGDYPESLPDTFEDPTRAIFEVPEDALNGDPDEPIDLGVEGVLDALTDEEHEAADAMLEKLLPAALAREDEIVVAAEEVHAEAEAILAAANDTSEEPPTEQMPERPASTEPSPASQQQPIPAQEGIPKPAAEVPVPEPAPAAEPSAPVSSKKEVQPLIRIPVSPPDVQRSPVRRIVGARRVEGDQGVLFTSSQRTPIETPPLLLDVAFSDQIVSIGAVEHEEPAEKLPRMYDEDFMILVLLDRVGLALPSMLRQAVAPRSAERSFRGRLQKLYDAGLIGRHDLVLKDRPRGRVTPVYSLTKHGFWVAQNRQPSGIPQQRNYRALDLKVGNRFPHDTHLLGWLLTLHRLLGDKAGDEWLTPRYATGRFPVPRVGEGRHKTNATIGDIPVTAGVGIFDLQAPELTEIKPDGIVEVKLKSMGGMTFDVLIEMDLTDRPAYNREKFIAYDAFLLGWSLLTDRYSKRHRGRRPVVVFVCPNAKAALAYAEEADKVMTGHLGASGTPPEDHYYPGRDHIFFAIEEDLHHGNPGVLALPQEPPGLRRKLKGDDGLSLERVALFPQSVLSGAKGGSAGDDSHHADV